MAKGDAGRNGTEMQHENHRDGSCPADGSGLVSHLPACPIVSLRAHRLALVPVVGRLSLESCFTRRCCRSRRARQRYVVCVSCPRREAVAGGVGSLRPAGTREGDSLTEELSCSSSVASLGNELWCRTWSWRSPSSRSMGKQYGWASPPRKMWSCTGKKSGSNSAKKHTARPRKGKGCWSGAGWLGSERLPARRRGFRSPAFQETAGSRAVLQRSHPS